MPKKIRDVVYGFVEADEQECAIIDHPVFQRLRRIKQLALTDMVYPGATHTRFEHSLGVMQMATDMFDSIIKNDNNKNLLTERYSLDDSGIKNYRKIIRLAALLHDVGHPPFSHSGEGLMPVRHEDYSIAIIKEKFRELIENHPINTNYNIRVEDVTALLGDNTVKPKGISLLWKELISGQLDADRADYLLRDSVHLGVKYGLYDRSRLVNCMTLGKTDTGALTTAIQERAWHVAESLVLARYQMFTQVYFHKVRRIYDYHIARATENVLKYRGFQDGCYPLPRDTSLEKYLNMDDHVIFSDIQSEHGGKHGDIILNRNHYKCLYTTELIASEADNIHIQELSDKYAGQECFLDDKIRATWYKDDTDIWIRDEKETLQPLKGKSAIVASMIDQPTQQRFYISRALA